MNKSQNKTVLVTGGAGFIGSHLCERLLRDGYEVICLDNYSTGSKENISHLFTNPSFEAIRHDVVQSVLIEADWIFHLACPASPIRYQLNPIKTMKTSVLGSLNLLGLAKRTGARILLAGTSEVYGDPQQHPQTEEYWGYVNPIGVRSCYDEGKRCAEALFMDYFRTHRVAIRMARIFNTFGPKMAIDDGRVVSNFITQALQGLPLTVYGDGLQTRSFCYVSDMVEGLIRLMLHEGPEQHLPHNLGNPNEFTMLDLAEAVIELTGSTSQLIYEPLPQDDPRRRQPDISRAETNLKWEPSVPLDEGLSRAIADFRGRIFPEKTPCSEEV